MPCSDNRLLKAGIWHVIALLLLAPVTLFANDAKLEPFPEPLTLDFALSLVDEAHPELLLARSDNALAAAGLQAASAEDDIDISIEGRLRWVDPLVNGEGVIDDHKVSLFLRKKLYDFGRDSALRDAAGGEVAARELRYMGIRSQHRVAIMQAFFDVLLADHDYGRDNEAMAVAYITLDRLRNRQELGQASDIDVLEQESAYQAVRYRLTQSEARQRTTRSRLASLLNRPGMLPSELARPKLAFPPEKIADYQPILETALANNPTLRALQQQLDAAARRVEAARAQRMPTLAAELEASDYTRELGSNDRWRAGVTLSVPLYTGGRVDAAIAREQAQLYAVQAQLGSAQNEIRETLLELWLELQKLKVERQRAKSDLDYRELYLDRSRANYEMEVQADLGDAMVRMSEAQLALIKSEFQTALVWERLQALVGADLPTPALAP